MEKINKKGFTLIELLAVIVIMGILMMVAIPAMTRYIENSRKDTFIDTAKNYVNSVRNMWSSDSLSCGSTVSGAVGDGDYYVLIDSKNDPNSLLDSGGKSSWGNREVLGYVHVNVKSAGTKAKTTYGIFLTDGEHGTDGELYESGSQLIRGNIKSTKAHKFASASDVETFATSSTSQTLKPKDSSASPSYDFTTTPYVECVAN